MRKWLSIDFDETVRGRSPADAYAVLADLEGWPSWTEVIVDTKWQGTAGWREGARFAFKPGVGGLGFWLPVTVTKVRENEEITWGVTVPGLLEVRHSFLFEKDGADVKVRNRESLAGPLGLLLALATGPVLWWGDRKWLRGLCSRAQETAPAQAAGAPAAGGRKRR